MNQRILSVDVLRGLTVAMMILVNSPGSWTYVYGPLKHAAWHGCTPTDLVFPSFIFVVGLSMSLSFSKSALSKSSLALKVLKRALIIFGLGLLLNWFPFFGRSLDTLRIFGVLQRIACSFLLAGLIISFVQNVKLLTLISLLLMALHWWVLDYFGDHESASVFGAYSLEGNVAQNIDKWLVGERHIYKGFGIRFDPEGVLGTLSAAAQVIIAYIFGLRILRKQPNLRICLSLCSIGMFFIFISWLLCHVVPINKPLWTPSYVLHTTGYILILWSLIIYLVDILKIGWWHFVFKVFGKNPLISFILSVLIVKVLLYVIRFDETNGYKWLYSSIYKPIFGNHFGSLMFALSMVFVVWLTAWLLHRKNIIIKV